MNNEPIKVELQIIAANLKRCPFCGNRASLPEKDCALGYIVMCRNRHCLIYVRGDTRREAFEKWNNRTE
jgi:hypothetical protein